MLIGIPEASRRMGVSSDSARRSLKNAGVPLVRINSRAFAVEENDLETHLARRSGYAGLGRPKNDSFAVANPTATTPEFEEDEVAIAEEAKNVRTGADAVAFLLRHGVIGSLEETGEDSVAMARRLRANAQNRRG